MPVRWKGDRGDLNGTQLRFVTSNYENAVTTQDEVVVLKGPWHDSAYRRLFNGLNVERILEFGIFEGGSALLLADIFPSAKIVGVDMRKPNPAVQYHLERLGLSERVKLHYGTLQDDRAAIERIMDIEFGKQSIDLIIDDCSHMYDLTKQSFDIAFPRLRSGGQYVIEDWDWAHYRTNTMHNKSSPVLSNLVFELTSALTSSPDQVVEARIIRGLAMFEKGSATHSLRADQMQFADRNWPKI